MVKVMNLEIIKQRKLLFFLVVITIISFVGGLLFISILSKSNQELVKSSINTYFEGVSKGKFFYLKSLYCTLSCNLLMVIFLWIMGISIVGGIVAVGVLIYKSFLVGFSFASIIYTYGIKGTFLGFIYIIPEVILLGLLFVFVYYVISFSILLFKMFFMKKEYNKKIIVTRYVKLLVIAILGVVVYTIISVFLVPNLLRLF